MSERGFSVTFAEQLQASIQLVSEDNTFSPLDFSQTLPGDMWVAYDAASPPYTYYPPLNSTVFQYSVHTIPPGWGGGSIDVANPVWERWADFTPLLDTQYGPIVAGVAQYIETPEEFIDQTLVSWVCLRFYGAEEIWVTYPPPSSIDIAYYLCDELPWDENGVSISYPVAERGIEPIGVLMSEISTDMYAGAFQVFQMIPEIDQTEIGGVCLLYAGDFLNDKSYPPKTPVIFPYEICSKDDDLNISYGEAYTRLAWPNGFNSLAIGNNVVSGQQSGEFWSAESLETGTFCISYEFPNPVSWFIYPPLSPIQLLYTYCYQPPREGSDPNKGAIIAEAEFEAPPGYINTATMDPAYAQTIYTMFDIGDPVFRTHPTESLETYAIDVDGTPNYHYPDIPLLEATKYPQYWPWVWTETQYIGPRGVDNAGYYGTDENGDPIPDPGNGPGTDPKPDYPDGWPLNDPDIEPGDSFDTGGGSATYPPPEFEQEPPPAFLGSYYEATEYGEDPDPHVTYWTQFDYQESHISLETYPITMGDDQFVDIPYFSSLHVRSHIVTRWIEFEASSGREQTEIWAPEFISWMRLTPTLGATFTEYGPYMDVDSTITTAYFSDPPTTTEYYELDAYNSNQYAVFPFTTSQGAFTEYYEAYRVHNYDHEIGVPGSNQMNTGEFDGYYPLVELGVPPVNVSYIDSGEFGKHRVSLWEMFEATWHIEEATKYGHLWADNRSLAIDVPYYLATEHDTKQNTPWPKWMRVGSNERTIKPFSFYTTEYGEPVVGTEQFTRVWYYDWLTQTRTSLDTTVTRSPEVVDVPFYSQDFNGEYRHRVYDDAKPFIMLGPISTAEYGEFKAQNEDYEMFPTGVNVAEYYWPTIFYWVREIDFDELISTQTYTIDPIVQRDVYLEFGNLLPLTETYLHVVKNELNIINEDDQYIYHPNYGEYDGVGDPIVVDPETEYYDVDWVKRSIEPDMLESLVIGKAFVSGGSIQMYWGTTYTITGDPHVEHEHREIEMLPRFFGDKPPENTDEAYEVIEFGIPQMSPQYIAVCSDWPMTNIEENCLGSGGEPREHIAYHIELQHRRVFPPSWQHPNVDEESPDEDLHIVEKRGGIEYIVHKGSDFIRYGNFVIYPHPQKTYVTGSNMTETYEFEVENTGNIVPTDREVDAEYTEFFEYDDVIIENFHRTFIFWETDQFKFDKWICSELQDIDHAFEEKTMYPDDPDGYPENTWVSWEPQLRNIEEYDTLLTHWTRWKWRMKVEQKPVRIGPIGLSLTRVGITRVANVDPTPPPPQELP